MFVGGFRTLRRDGNATLWRELRSVSNEIEKHLSEPIAVDQNTSAELWIDKAGQFNMASRLLQTCRANDMFDKRNQLRFLRVELKLSSFHF